MSVSSGNVVISSVVSKQSKDSQNDSQSQSQSQSRVIISHVVEGQDQGRIIKECKETQRNGNAFVGARPWQVYTLGSSPDGRNGNQKKGKQRRKTTEQTGGMKGIYRRKRVKKTKYKAYVADVALGISARGPSHRRCVLIQDRGSVERPGMNRAWGRSFFRAYGGIITLQPQPLPTWVLSSPHQYNP
jgi:hypothetical protein